MNVEIYKLPMSGPEDLSGLRTLIEDGTITPNEIAAIIVKTEGNGNVNDFTRGYTTFAIKSMLSNYLDCTLSNVSERVSIVCSGGCEGVMSPHATVFTKKNANENKVSDVSNGHFICTKCTSFTSSILAYCIASLTAFATSIA